VQVETQQVSKAFAGGLDHCDLDAEQGGSGEEDLPPAVADLPLD
jgi:hypothetical protein